MHVGIVGAGIVGQLLAYRLQQRGVRVSLFSDVQRLPKNSASLVAAGLLTPYAEMETASCLILRLGLASIIHWKAWLPQLPVPVFHQFHGGILSAHPSDKAELMRYLSRTADKLPEHAMQHWHAGTLQHHEPELSCLKEGLFFPEEGQLAPRELLYALSIALTQAGAVWHLHTPVTRTTPGRVYARGRVYGFDWVVDCRGYRAQSVWPTLRGVRGEVMHLHAPHVQIHRPLRLLTPRYTIYIAPRPNQHYILGASEIDSADHSPISLRTTLELGTAVYSIHAGFGEARILGTFVGVRPALVHNQPRIRYHPGWMAINGLYRHGFLIAPAVIESAVTLMMQGEVAVPHPMLCIRSNTNRGKEGGVSDGRMYT